MVQGQPVAALGDYTRCVELAPGNPQALRGRGKDAELGEHALAIADFEDALAVQLDDAQALRPRREPRGPGRARARALGPRPRS
ncbi:MAG: hypothetical protein R3F62_05935 [Planctomycetota bacterium]